MRVYGGAAGESVADGGGGEAGSGVDGGAGAGVGHVGWADGCWGWARRLARGSGYALARYDRRALLLVIVCMALNWLGDSLDGTLARVRRQQRPRYGFYVDHMVDIFGSVALMGGLGCSGLLHWQTAMAMLVAFLLLSGESYLATYTLSCFQLSQGIVWADGDSDSADRWESGAAAESVRDAVRASDAAVRSGRSDCGGGDVRDGGDRDGAAHGAALSAGAAAMNTFVRWGKFNLVGAVGMVVQLAALALFNRLAPGHYLFATAAAIELALLHNFVWHVHYTWRDRRDGSALLSRLLRFHLSNGLVSMVGNLALMRVLVQGVHLPLLVANGIAILCCSVVNFCLGNSWAFAVRGGVAVGDGAVSRT